MANQKSVAQSPTEQTVPGNVNEVLTDVTTEPTNGETTPTEIVVPVWRKILESDWAEQDGRNEGILAELMAERKAAKKAWSEKMAAADFEETDETAVAEKAVKAADDAIIEFNKTLTALKLEREAEVLLNGGKHNFSELSGLTVAQIEGLLAQPNDVKDRLKAAFTQIFGKPVYYAKAGETGKDVSKKTAPKADVSRETSSTDGVPEDESPARKKIYADLLAGMTYAELLQKYPTYDKKSDSYNYEKLNGTARTVITDYGWKQDTATKAYYIPAVNS